MAGRPYYLNHNLGTTHWDPPDPPDAAGSSHSSHPAVMTTHPRQNVEEHGNVSGDLLVILNSFLFSLIAFNTFFLPQAPAEATDRTVHEREWGRSVRRRLEPSPGTVVPILEPGPVTVVPRLEPGPVTVVSTGEPSIPVSNDQFEQCLATHVHEDAGKIPPGDEFRQAWWKAQRQYFENSTHAQKKKGTFLQIAWNFTQLSPLFLSNCRKTQADNFVSLLATAECPIGV